MRHKRNNNYISKIYVQIESVVGKVEPYVATFAITCKNNVKLMAFLVCGMKCEQRAGKIQLYFGLTRDGS